MEMGGSMKGAIEKFKQEWRNREGIAPETIDHTQTNIAMFAALTLQ